MDVTEKYKKLVKALLRKTEAMEIEWQEMPTAGVYMAALKDNAITIAEVEGRSAPSSTDYEIALVNANGSVVDSFRDVELDREEPGSPWYMEMRTLYEMARRRALGSDKILNDILSELDAPPF